MLRDLRTDPASSAPAPAPIRPEDGVRLHSILDRLEEAIGFSSETRNRIHLLEDRLVQMQLLAEKVGDDPGTLEDREVAFAKIEILAHQCDVIAKRPVLQKVPALEGGLFRFEFPREDSNDALEVEVPNLRARDEGSLALLTHYDSMIAAIGTGGRVLRGLQVERSIINDQDEQLPEPLPEGSYRIELTYLALDASRVQLRLLPEHSDVPLIVVDHVDLSAAIEPVEVDLGVGLCLTIERIARAAEAEIESSTTQQLDWHHDVGERLNTVDGSFTKADQPRDFELYALYLEGPLRLVRDAQDRLKDFEEDLEREIETILQRLGAPTAEPADLPPLLAPQAPGWRVLDTQGLREALT